MAHAPTQPDRVRQAVAGGVVEGGQQLTQDAAVQGEQGAAVLDVGDRPFQITDSYPDLMTPADMQRAFRISSGTFYTLLGRSVFDRFEIKPAIGRRAWSGALVADYIRSGGSARGFGRKRVS